MTERYEEETNGSKNGKVTVEGDVSIKSKGKNVVAMYTDNGTINVNRTALSGKTDVDITGGIDKGKATGVALYAKDGGKITVKKEITDVKQLFKKIKKDYELLNIKNEMIIKVNNEVNIFVDKNLISEALRGLIDNCIKYSIGNIELIAREDEVVEIIVRNYGERIPEEEKKNLFNRNFQGKNAKKGSGLGLPIIKDIILLNDGKIYLENRKDGVDVKIQFKKIDYKNEWINKKIGYLKKLSGKPIFL